MSFSIGLTKTLFDIPISKILKLSIIVEKSSTIWPDEYIFLEVDSEYLKLVIEPILSADKSVEYSKLIKIKYLKEQVIQLSGVNNTIFKEQLFKLKYGESD
jgi:hypothetical protein